MFTIYTNFVWSFWSNLQVTGRLMLTIHIMIYLLCKMYVEVSVFICKCGWEFLVAVYLMKYCASDIYNIKEAVESNIQISSERVQRPHPRLGECSWEVKSDYSLFLHVTPTKCFWNKWLHWAVNECSMENKWYADIPSWRGIWEVNVLWSDFYFFFGLELNKECKSLMFDARYYGGRNYKVYKRKVVCL